MNEQVNTPNLFLYEKKKKNSSFIKMSDPQSAPKH